MGSLFTRSFLFFWATILMSAAITAAIVRLNFLADVAEPRRLAREAQAVLDAGGRQALEQWIVHQPAQLEGSRTRVLVLDAEGRDLLGRPVPRFHHGFGEGPRPAGPPPGDTGPPGPPPGAPSGVEPGPGRVWPADAPVFPRLLGRDGARYVLVLDPLPAHGPFTPPFSTATILALLAIAVLVSGLVSYAFARSISRPLERLQTAARRYAGGDLAARADARDAARRDEIGGLAREFDSMSARLEALIEARKQLLRDMSHELRSPLARLQMAVGIARQPGADAARQLERIERESERLEALLSRILEFARLERDPATLAREEVDLAELVQRVVHDAEFESQAPAGRITLAMGAEAQWGWARLPNADPAVLHTAVDNVVRNALLHGGDGSIEVEVAATRDEVAITVRDHGRGVPPRDLERIFEPFYRVATDTPRAEGYGVGLALAQRAVALHGGGIVAENADDGGLRVRIVFPRARPGPP